MSESSFSTISGTSIGSSLMDILYCDEIKPGDTPSYNLAKTIYLYHPFGAKLAEGPCKLAQSQKRIINIPGTPEESLIEAFEREWKTLKCDFHILNADTIKSIYGASVLIYGSKNVPLNEPIQPDQLANLELYFSVLDPLNVSGSLVSNQSPNSPDFQKHGDIVSNGTQYHRSRCCVMFNELPIYIAYNQSTYGYIGRSVYQRCLYQLKSFVQSMITDNHVQEKAGLLVVKSKKPGSIIDNVMSGIANIKRSMLKGAKTGNVLEIGENDSIETLNMQNTNVAMETSRNNIIQNIALASGRPARLLTEESFTRGFGEGVEDAKAIAAYIEAYRINELEPLYEFLTPIVQYRAWNREFYETIQKQYPDFYGDLPYETAIAQWRNAFKAEWPNLIKEPDSEAVKVQETKFKAINDAVTTLKDDMDPDNKARLFQWMADCFNEQKMLFQSPLDLDFEAMVQYQEQQKEEEKAQQAEQLAAMQDGGGETAFGDDAGEHWVTMHGSHVLIDDEGNVIDGAGGKLSGKKFENIKSKSPDISNKQANKQTPEASFQHHESSKGIFTDKHLPEHYKNSISAYIGEHYRAINRTLRQDNHQAFASQADTIAEHIMHLENAFNHVPPTTKDAIVYRKTGKTAIDAMLKAVGSGQLKKGSILADDGIMSTSHDAGVFPGAVGFEIKIPKGAKAIDLSETINREEQEVILPPGTKLKVVEAKKDNKGYNMYIKCEVIL